MMNLPVITQLVVIVVLVVAGAGLAFQMRNKLGYLLIVAGLVWGYMLLPALTQMGRQGPAGQPPPAATRPR